MNAAARAAPEEHGPDCTCVACKLKRGAALEEAAAAAADAPRSVAPVEQLQDGVDIYEELHQWVANASGHVRFHASMNLPSQPAAVAGST